MNTSSLIYIPGIGHALRHKMFKGIFVFMLFYSPFFVALWSFVNNITLTREWLLIGAGLLVSGTLWHICFLIKEFSLKISPLKESVEEIYEKGRVASLRGNYDLAKFYFENILKINEKDEDAAYQLGIAYQETGEHKKTAKLYKKFLNAGCKKWHNEMSDYLKGLKK